MATENAVLRRQQVIRWLQDAVIEDLGEAADCDEAAALCRKAGWDETSNELLTQRDLLLRRAQVQGLNAEALEARNEREG